MAALASTLVPLAINELPALVNLIVGLVHGHAPVVEAKYGPQTGAVKFSDVFAFVMQALINAKAAGQISTLPDENTVKIAIQAAVSSMQLNGQLQGTVPTTTTTPAPAQQDIVLSAGQQITIRVG